MGSFINYHSKIVGTDPLHITEKMGMSRQCKKLWAGQMSSQKNYGQVHQISWRNMGRSITHHGETMDRSITHGENMGKAI